MQSYGDFHSIPRNITISFPTCMDKCLNLGQISVEQGTATSIKTTYPICGKTGTIENPGEDHSAFIAFASMNNPKIAIAVYIEHGGFGADLAAPIAGLIIEQYLKGKLSEASEAKAARLEKRK